MKKIILTASVFCLCIPSLKADFFEGFDGGSNGNFTGNAFFEPTGGNPGGNAHIDGVFFFPEIRTGGLGEPANPGFLGDFSNAGQITISFDVRVDSLTDFNGNQIFRPFGVMLLDRDIQGPNGPSGVFFETEFLGASIQDDWTTYSVVIDDPTATDLPSGWIGFGDEDPNTFEPILPAGASFASVLASVDEFRLTGAVPGFFFTDAGFDMRIDNVGLKTSAVIPEPSFLVLVLAGSTALSVHRRRR